MIHNASVEVLTKNIVKITEDRVINRCAEMRTSSNVFKSMAPKNC